LSAEALATFRILPRNGRIAWVARLLGRATGAVAFNEKDLGSRRTVAGAVGELAGQAQLARRGLARQLALLAPAQAFLGPLRDAVEELPRGRRIGAQPVVEMVLDSVFDEPGCLDRGEPLLGLTLKLRIVHEEGQQQRCARGDILASRLSDAAITDELAIPFDRAQQRAAQPGIMGPAFRGRNGVAIGMAEAVFLVLGPRYCPFDTAAFGKIHPSEEWPRCQHRPPVKARQEKVAEPTRKMQPGLDRDSLGTRQRRVAGPADLETAEEIGLGPRHPVEHRRAKPDATKDLRIGMEAQGRATPVVYRPTVDEPGLGHTPAVALAP